MSRARVDQALLAPALCHLAPSRSSCWGSLVWERRVRRPQQQHSALESYRHELLLLKAGGSQTIEPKPRPYEDPVLHWITGGTAACTALSHPVGEGQRVAESHPMVPPLTGCPASEAGLTNTSQPSPQTLLWQQHPLQPLGREKTLTKRMGHGAAGTAAAPGFDAELRSHRVPLAVGTLRWETQLVRVGTSLTARAHHLPGCPP